MAMLSLLGYWLAPADRTLPRITDLALVPTQPGGTPTLYATTRYGGVLSGWTLAANSASALSTANLLRPDAAGAVSGIGTLHSGTTTYLITGGGTGGDMLLHPLAANGSIAAPRNLGRLPQFGGDLIALETVDLGAGQSAVYGGILGKSGIGRLTFGTAANLMSSGTTADTALTHADRVVALAHTQISGVNYLFSASTLDAGVSAWAVASNGTLQATANFGASQGLWITAPTALEALHLGRETFLIVAAAGSGSLSVLEIEPNGALRMAAHVLDDLGSRFAGATALACAEINGQAYLVAGGSDDGLTLFQMLPGGRLLALTTLADTLQMGLSNISALSLRATATGLDIFAASAAEPGITQLHYTLGTAGVTLHASSAGATLTGGAGADILCGGFGADLLIGGSGDDIVLDGDGSDQMQGGIGADTFVLSADSRADSILDFTLGQDRIDLSAWPMLRDLRQLTLTATATGMTIRYGSETVTLVSATSQPIQPAQLRWADLYNLNQIWSDPGVPIEPDLNIGGPGDIVGSAAADTLLSTSKAERLFGMAGNDALFAGLGRDSLYGGLGDDSYTVQDADDVVVEATSQGVDKVAVAVSYSLIAAQSIEFLSTTNAAGTTTIALTGNALAQTITGNAGANILNTGGGAADLLIGGAGDDSYVIANAADRIIEAANQGIDRAYASVSYSLTASQSVEFLSTTNTAGTTAIALTGNALAQTITGNAGANVLNGGGGLDTLIGGLGADSFVFNATLGAANVDRISDFNVISDQILLENSAFLGLPAGRLAATAFVGNLQGAAMDTADRIIYETDTGRLWFDRDGTGAATAICFATLAPSLAVTAADFLVI